MGGPGVTTRQVKTGFEKAEVLARVAEAQAQVKKWMEEFDEQDSKRVKKLGGKSTAGKGDAWSLSTQAVDYTRSGVVVFTRDVRRVE